jgi:trigger factor
VAVSREITHLDNSAVRLTFTYGAEELNAKYKEIVEGFAKDFQIKGFRKGKVPISVLERKLGKALKNEVLNAIISETITEALKDESFPDDALPLARVEPQVDGDPQLDLVNGLVFSFTYDVAPKAKVEKWEGLELEADTAEVTDEDVERELDDIRARNAIVKDKDDDAAAETGDVVTIDYCELSESGEEIPDTKREGVSLILGDPRNSFEYYGEIAGMKTGESRDIAEKKLRVKLTGVKQQELPDDDELAQDVSESFKTIDDLKQHIREDLQQNLEARLRRIKLDKIFEKLAELNPTPIPESLIEQELNEFVMRHLYPYYNGGDMEALSEQLKPMREDFRPIVVKNIHTQLIAIQLAKDLNIEVSDDEIKERLEAIGKNTFVTDGSEKDHLIAEIKQNKLFDILLAKNTIKAGKKVKFLDIFSENA